MRMAHWYRPDGAMSEDEPTEHRIDVLPHGVVPIPKARPPRRSHKT
jgi:hypothetical protein